MRKLVVVVGLLSLSLCGCAVVVRPPYHHHPVYYPAPVIVRPAVVIPVR